MLNAELRVMDGKQSGKSIPLTGKKFLVGREADCQLRPNSDLVSRHHCVFTIDEFSVRLRDLGSTNGTYVNGKRLNGLVVLQPGDQVSIGKLTLELVVRATETVAEQVLPEVDPVVSDDTLHGASDTSDGLTAAMPIPAVSGDTAMLQASDVPAAEQQAVLVGQETVQQSVMPGYFPPGMPAGAYPQGMPGMMPGYPMMPGMAIPGMMPGYPQMMMPGMMMPGMMPGMMAPNMMPAGMAPPGMQTVQMPGMMPQVAPVTPLPATAGTDKVSKIAAPPVVLPDPEDTGATAPAPKPAAAPSDPSKPAAANPSSAAADIIRQHMQKRR